MINEADRILVVGSSCMVFSVYRLLLQANKDNKPIAIVNMGETRADDIATLKIEQPAGLTLQQTLNYLTRNQIQDLTL